MGFSFCIFVIFDLISWKIEQKIRNEVFPSFRCHANSKRSMRADFFQSPHGSFFCWKNCCCSFCHCRQETTLVGWSRFVGATDVKRYDERSDRSYKITLHITLNLLFHVTEELTSMPTTPMKLKTFRQWRFISEVIEKWNRSLGNDLTQSVNRSPLRICQNAYTFLT